MLVNYSQIGNIFTSGEDFPRGKQEIESKDPFQKPQNEEKWEVGRIGR